MDESALATVILELGNIISTLRYMLGEKDGEIDRLTIENNRLGAALANEALKNRLANTDKTKEAI